MNEPLRALDARRLAREILSNGDVIFSRHALERLAQCGKTTVDAVNVIRGGAYGDGEWENGGWRYRASTQRMAVVLEFDSETQMVIVTAFTLS